MTEGGARTIPLDNSIIILTGGQDVTGNLLLSIPTNRMADIGDYTIGDLTSLFLRMMAISKYMRISTGSHSNRGQGAPVAFLADLRQAPTQVLHPLVEVLEAVEHNQRGSIAAVYFLKPKSTSKSHILKKLLGMKPSKKRPRVPLFKIVLMKSLQELYTQIDMRHLTIDFSGTLKYSHHAWMFLYENVVQCIEEGNDLMTKLPSIRDRVDLLQEYEPDGQSSTKLQQLVTDLTEKFHHIITESSLPMCLTRCKQTLFSLDNISPSSLLSSLHPNLLSGYCSCLHALYSELDQWNKSLEEAWRTTESHFTLIIQYNRHSEKAKEIERKICDHYSPLLKEHPIVGRTLSQAELYRAHFTTTLYEPAKELLNQATEILEAMQKVKNSASSLSSSSTNTGVSSTLMEIINNMDISNISRSLTTSIQPFTVHMQQLQDLYVSIHVFHLLFEKALTWYKKVLKFLPESLLHSWTSDSDISQSDPTNFDISYQGGQSRIVYMPPEWLGAVRVFLDRHPPPRDEHINRLDVSTPNVVDKKLRAQARSLALRLRLLERVLSSTRLPLKLVMAVTGWKFELFGTSHTERSPGHGSFHSHSKEITKNEIFSKDQSEEESTAQENKWVSSSNPDDARNDSSGTNSQGKKSVNFEQSTTSSMKSSTDKKNKEESINKGDQMANKRAAIANRIQMRKNSKSLLRAKSVEFSFNSSSTDGSVFDYEKAVSRARQIHDHERQEEKSFSVGGGLKKNTQKVNEDQKRVHVRPRSLQKNKEIEDYGRDVNTSNTRDREEDKYSFYVEQVPTFNITNYEEYPGQTENQTLNGNLERKHESENPSFHERYVGLSYRSLPKNKSWSKYHSMDDLLQADQSVAEEEFESGIDTMDHTHLDPYDLLVKRIKDISASDLPNFEKLKRVSTLIANSSMAERDNSQQQQNSAKKLSFSTFDLRDKGLTEDSNDHAIVRAGQYRVAQFSENPVEAVVRMKQNLAKSMEELSTYQLSMMSDEGGKTFSKSEVPLSSTPQHRYHTELKFQPMYANSMQSQRNHETLHKPAIDETKRQENYASYQGRHSDSLEFSAGLSTHKVSTDINEIKPDSDTQTKKESSPTKKRRFQVRSLSGQEDKRQQSLAGISNATDNDRQQGRKLSSSRPTSIGHLAGRTFISPSFLRPATSMRNISSQGHENLTFELMKSMNLDCEDIIDSFESNMVMDETSYHNNQDLFPEEHMHAQYDDKNSAKRPFAQSKEDNKTSVSPSGIFRRKFSSFDQARNNYMDPPGFSNHPWSISTDATVYPIFSPDVQQQQHLKLSDLDVERLNSEAEMASLDQEEVANSLRKTQQILEEEEKRRSNGLENMILGNDEDSNGSHQRQLIQSESIDNGYGSWASKLISAPSTTCSSEGPEVENVVNEGWTNTVNTSFESVRRTFEGKSSQGQSSFDKTQE